MPSTADPRDHLLTALARHDGLGIARALLELAGDPSIVADPAIFAAAAVRMTLDPDHEEVDAFLAMAGIEVDRD